MRLIESNLGDRWIQAIYWSGDRLEDVYLVGHRLFKRVAPNFNVSDAVKTLFESLSVLAVIMIAGVHLHWSRSLQLAYVVPILMATHRSGPKWGLLIAVLTTALTAIVDLYAVHELPIKLAFESGIRFAVLASIVLVVRHHQRELAGTIEIARRDGLTGALNRGAIEDAALRQVHRVTLSQGRMILAMIDCDNFKWINDHLGHLFGDQVLKTLVRILQATMGPGCSVGRTGGDEFIVVVPELGRETVSKFLDKALQQFQDATLVMGAKTSFSYGIAEFTRDGVTLEALIESADRDMYHRKSHKAAVVFTAPKVRTA